MAWAAVGLALLLEACSNQTRPPVKSAGVLDVLPAFTADNVPAAGPEESPDDPPRWTVSAHGSDPALPGRGLAQHPMLYIGEGWNTMYVVDQGKVIWSYTTGKGNELDDIWLLSNGNILFSRMGWAGEVTPQKKIVWRIEAPEGTEIHALQPLGLDRVFLVQNGHPARLMIINKKTEAVELDHALAQSLTGEGVHGQFRHARMTEQGTFLLPLLQKGRVVELDKNFNEIWSYATPRPWAAIRLKNGNTLISDEEDDAAREVDPQGVTVWEFSLKKDLPPGIEFSSSQSCIRLASGNTIFCSRGNGGKTPQLLEVTPDKKVVWVLKDWKNLGPASAIQVLDDPGIPEKAGDLQR